MLSKLFKDVRNLFLDYCFTRIDHNVIHITKVTKSQYAFNIKVENAIENKARAMVKLIVSTSLKYNNSTGDAEEGCPNHEYIVIIIHIYVSCTPPSCEIIFQHVSNIT
jgi:hypothetical protein